jgi:hypothetical protein
MVTQDNEKYLFSLREQIEQCLFEKLSGDEDSIKAAKDILTPASIILKRAKTKEELIALYTMIGIRLAVFSNYCAIFYEVNSSNTLHKISRSLYECIEAYLSDNIDKIELVKSIWPYESSDIDSVKSALSEYILHNVFMFGPGYIFTHNFMSKYENEIKAAKTPRDLMKVYNKIQKDAFLNAWRFHNEGKYSEGLQYDILSGILRYMIYDFRDLISMPI